MAGAFVCASLLFTACSNAADGGIPAQAVSGGGTGEPGGAGDSGGNGGGGSGDGNGGGNASFVPPAIEMKTGPEINALLNELDFTHCVSVEPSKTLPKYSLLQGAKILSKNMTQEDCLSAYATGQIPGACIAWKDGTVIYYYAYGYTDRGNKIPLNADSSKMFQSGTQNIPLSQIDISGFDTKHVENANFMFERMGGLTSLDLTGFDASSLTSAWCMFSACNHLKRIYVSAGTDWRASGKITNSKDMFAGCWALTGGKGSGVYSSEASFLLDYAHIDGGEEDRGYFTDAKQKPVLQRIEVDASADSVKKEYFTGDAADASNVKVTAYYLDSDGAETSEVVSSGFTAELDSSTAGQKDVTVTYRKDGVAKTATYTVNVTLGCVVTVKHMFENLADSNYATLEETSAGVAAGTTYTPAAIAYDSDIFTLETSLSPVTINENKTIEVKYKRSLCAIAFTAVSKDGTNLQFDSSFKSQIEAIPGVSKVTVQTLSDAASPKLSITAKSGTNLAKLNDANFVKVKGYRRDASAAIQTTYSESSNKDANGYAKVMKPSLNGMEWKITWRLPTINMETGNSFYAILWELGANNDVSFFVPSKTPPQKNVAAADKRQISLNYSSDGSQQMEVLAYAWRFYNKSNGMYYIYYYAECGNDAEGYPKIPISNVAAMFNQCSSLQYIDLSGFDIKGPTSMESMFRDCKRLTQVKFGKVDTSKVETMKEMFCNCENLEKFEYPNFVTAACKNLSLMFYNCSSPKNIVIDMSNWNTSSVTTMSNMFAKSYAGTLDISSFDMGNITDVSGMFGQCPRLTTIYVAPGTDWSAKSWKSDGMFDYCLNLSGKPSGRKYSDGTGVTTDVDKSYAKVTGGYFTAKN